MIRRFGLIGYPLAHSFSPAYFQLKFELEGISDARYELFPLPALDGFREWFALQKNLAGLNVTVPFKEAILTFLDEIDTLAAEIGAVNTLQIRPDGKIKGWNTDFIGFQKTILPYLGQFNQPQALVLGSGGGSLAVQAVLKHLSIPFQIVSRKPGPKSLTYEDLQKNPEIIKTTRFLIQTTPVGMFPDVEAVLPFPFQHIGSHYVAIDLVYNPSETRFLKECRLRGAQTQNGQAMLEAQAEASWAIWNTPLFDHSF